MTNWTDLFTAGNELARAFDLLDRADEICALTVMSAITKQGLLDAARDQVARAVRLMGR
jgi:ribulose-5-phosphate 4-epimerase/fuculose-1-phosphate aldolase